MCGICGFYNLDLNIEDSQTLIKRMTQRLVHRGPDDEGYFFSEKFCLGIRRLSIIDIQGGHQPIISEKGNIIIFNGEMYNYLEKRKELELKDIKFKTKSDTEVVLKLYENYGIDFLEHINGMFSLCIYDKNKDKFILARDRFGIKPLFYYFNNNEFLFASEIKAIIEYKKIKRKINFKAMDLFLSFQAVPAPLSFFEKINKLEPAHYLILENKKIIKKRYWDINYSPEYKNKGFFIEQVREGLEQSVKLRLRSDVEVGVLLSGGVDSSLITALASKQNKRIKSFSVGFKDDGYNEIEYAKRVSNYLGIENYDLVIDHNDYFKFVDKLIYHLDEPMSDLACPALFYLSKLAKKNVSVLLSGEGSDEIFAGYFDRYNDALKYLKFNFYRDKVFNKFNFYKKIILNNKRNQFLLDNFLYTSQYNFLNHLACYVYDNNLKQQLYSHNLKYLLHKVNIPTGLLKIKQKKLLYEILKLDLKYVLPDYLLMKADRMTMAAGIETRVPYLDYQLAEDIWQIPYENFQDFKNNNSKIVLKQIALKYLPENIVYRKKMGFPVPMKNWIKNQLKNQIAEIIFDKKTIERGYFDYNFIKKIWQATQDNKLNYSLHLWCLSLLEIWHRKFID